MTAKKYHHLSAEERAYIMFTMRADPSCSARAIARALQLGSARMVNMM